MEQRRLQWLEYTADIGRKQGQTRTLTFIHPEGAAQKQVAMAPMQGVGTGLLHSDLAGHSTKLIFPFLWQRWQLRWQ